MLSALDRRARLRKTDHTMYDIDPKISLKDAIEKAGNQSKLATALGINKANISEWKRDGVEFLPPIHAYRFERLALLNRNNN